MSQRATPETMKIRRRARVLAGRLRHKTCPRGRGDAIFGGGLVMKTFFGSLVMKAFFWNALLLCGVLLIVFGFTRSGADVNDFTHSGAGVNDKNLNDKNLKDKNPNERKTLEMVF